MMRVLGFPDGKPLGWRSGRVAEGTPLLRAQINIYWSRGFESLLLRQQVSYFPFAVSSIPSTIWLKKSASQSASCSTDFPSIKARASFFADS